MPGAVLARRPRRMLGLVVLLLVGVLGSPGTATGAPASVRGSDAPGGILVLESVSPWVEHEGIFSVRFEPSTEVPLDATFTWTIRQQLRTTTSRTARDAVDEVLDDGPGESVLQGPRTQSVLLLGDPADGLALDIPIRSSSGSEDRVLIPSAGIHPVDLELTSATGEALWSATVFLNRLPDTPVEGRDGQPARTAVQMLVSLDSGPALSSSGAFEIGPEERVNVTSLQSLLTEVSDVPLLVSLRPNTLVGISRSGDPGDLAFLEEVPTASWVPTRASYVRVDAEALEATGSDELGRQITAGDAVLAGVAPQVDNSLWLLDDTVDQASAGRLREAGVRHLLTSPQRFSLPDGVPDRWATGRTFDVAGVDGLTVSAYDAGLTRRLVEPDLDAALRAHDVVTQIMAGWFDAIDDGTSSFPGVTAAVALTPGVDAEVVTAVATALGDGSGPLALTPPGEATADDDEAVRVRLLDQAATDMSGVVRRTEQVGARIDGFRSMTSEANPDAASWDLINDQAPALVTDDAERQSFWDGVSAAISAEIAGIVPPPDRTVLITGRSATIPLRFRNDLGVEVRLLMRTRSPRLEFPEGETREIVLAPGANRIDVPVVVQAPGSSPLRVELSSPDRRLRLPDSSVTVRSSSISGVGAALSLVSLAVLIGWWVQTHRRTRHQRSEE